MKQEKIPYEQAINSELNKWEKAVVRHNTIVAATYEDDSKIRDAWVRDFENSKESILAPKEEFARENIVGTHSKVHQFEGGVEYFYAKYEEPNVMKQDGNLWGVNGAYSYRPNEGNLFYTTMANVFRIEAMFAMGDFDYEAIAAPQTGLKVDKEDSIYEIRGLIGKEYVMPSDDIVMFYAGLAYRYLNDDDEGNPIPFNGQEYYGYERESNYYYLPAGIEYATKFNHGWAVKARGEYDIFLFGQQLSHLSDGNKFLDSSAGEFNEDLTNDQKHGYGLRGSVQLAKDMGYVSLLLEPFVRYWNIEDSDIEPVIIEGDQVFGLEPENRTIELGMKVGLQF